MPTYIKTTNFLAKDSLPLNNAAKYVKGSEIDTEFDNIETADTDNMKKSAMGTGVENALLVNVGSAGAFSTAVAASQSDQETGTSTTAFVSPGRQQFHSSACKGWCKANAVGGNLASYNVTSIADTATGRMTVTWATDFSGSNYAIAAAIGGTGVAGACESASPAAGTTEIRMYDFASNLADPDNWHLMVFGDQ